MLLNYYSKKEKRNTSDGTEMENDFTWKKGKGGVGLEFREQIISKGGKHVF